MPKKKSKSSGGRAVLVVGLIAALGVGGLAAYVKQTPGASHIPPATQATTQSTSDDDVAPKAHRRRVDPDITVKSDKLDLMVPTLEGDEVKLNQSAGALPRGVRPMAYIADQAAKSLGLDGARVLGVDVKGHIAHLDINQAFAEFGFGSTQEGQVVKALQLGLGQFSEIDSFDLNCDGKKLETLGQLDLTDPIKVIRAGEPDNTPAQEG